MKPIPFDNRFIQLPERFYSREHPAVAPAPDAIRLNTALAEALGIDPHWMTSPEAIEVFAGNRIPPSSEPIATVYAGHQFGHWNPQLGDGRAILLGEVVDQEGQRYDIQLKGAGQTPYSRGGDGRAPLGPVLREYIVSEAMAALGIPTTRSLAAVTTGDKVFRDAILPGAILTRVAKSHIRVGHFQFFSARSDDEAVGLLADHVIERDFPDAIQAENPYLSLLNQVITRQAQLIAHWQLVGFIHGVMNTDNMLLCGETVDYGPCAFMDHYDPNTCFSSIDHGKRYAYKNQPFIAQWNLAWFAQSLLPLLHPEEKTALSLAQDAVNGFTDVYEHSYQTGLHNKLGITAMTEESQKLVEGLLSLMTTEAQDFTLTFRHLADLAAPESSSAKLNFQLPTTFSTLIQHWQRLLAGENLSLEAIQERMYRVNPAYIPRNHRVEEAINSAQQGGDFTPFHHLVDTLASPFELDPDNTDPTLPPEPHQRVAKTFCGT